MLKSLTAPSRLVSATAICGLSNPNDGSQSKAGTRRRSFVVSDCRSPPWSLPLLCSGARSQAYVQRGGVSAALI